MITIDSRSRVPIYEQIINSFKQLSLSGALKPGEKLPSVRELSKSMTLNPNTVQKAYKELERQGIIYVEKGKGTFVNENIEAVNKSAKMKNLYEEIKKVIVECMYLDIGKDEFKKIIDEAYDEITNLDNYPKKEVSTDD